MDISPEANGKRRPRRGTMWTRSHSFQGDGLQSRSCRFVGRSRKNVASKYVWKWSASNVDFYGFLVSSKYAVLPKNSLLMSTMTFWKCFQLFWLCPHDVAHKLDKGQHVLLLGKVWRVPQHDAEIFPHWAVPRIGVPPYHRWFPIIQNYKNDLRFFWNPQKFGDNFGSP